MSSPIGIGDAYLILTLTLNLCKDVRAAPEDIQAAARDIEQMKVVLKYLKTEVGDENSFMSKRKDVATVIVNGMKPLREDLKEMKDMLDDYISRPSISIMGRLQYAVLDKNRLRDLRTGFAVHRGSISMMLQVIHGTATKEQSSKLDQLLASHKELLESHKGAREEQKNHSKTTKTLLTQIENRISDSRTDTPISTADALQQVEDDLVARGTSRQKAKEQLQPFVEALLSEPSTPIRRRSPIPTKNRPTSTPLPETTTLPTFGATLEVPQRTDRPSSSPTEKSHSARPVRHGSSSKRQAHRNSTSSVPILPASEDKATDPNTEGLRILVVDGSNGIRSVFAQTYLEIMRAWIAHRTGRWLFKRVDSAGGNVGTDFARPFIDGEPFTNIGEAIPYEYVSQIDVNHYDWSLDYPNEIQATLNRMKGHRVRGLISSDFTTYDIMLCFDSGMRSRLLKMQAAVDHGKEGKLRQIRIISLRGGKHLITDEILADKTKMKEMADLIKKDIKAFITTELQQETSLKVNKGFRILQFELPSNGLPIVRKGETLTNTSKIKELEKQSGCEIKITRLVAGSHNTYLVSILGPKGSNVAQGSSSSVLGKVEAVIRGHKVWRGRTVE